MKTFLLILNRLFVVLGVIFFIILCFLAYLWFVDPLNIKPMFFGNENTNIEHQIEKGDPINPVGINEANEGVDKNPALTSEQEALLEKVGIDPASLPTEITPAQELCFRTKLGDNRVDEIVSGATPTVLEITKVSSCYSN